MEERATTVVHPPQVTENQTLLVSKPPAERQPHLFQQEEQS